MSMDVGGQTKYGAVTFDKKTGRPTMMQKTLGDFDAGNYIEQLKEIKEIPIKQDEDKNDIDQKLLEEMDIFQEKLAHVETLTNNLRNPIGIDAQKNINYFGDYLFANFTGGNAYRLPKTMVDVSIVQGTGAKAQNFEFEILAKAKADSIKSSTAIIDLTTTPVTTNNNLVFNFAGIDVKTASVSILDTNIDNALITANGTLKIAKMGSSPATTIDIPLTNGMKPEDVVSAINDQTVLTGIKASLESFNNTAKKLTLTSNIDGLKIDLTGTTAQILTDLNLDALIRSDTVNIPLTTTMDYLAITTEINKYSSQTRVSAELTSINNLNSSYELNFYGNITGLVIDPTGSVAQLKSDLGLTSVTPTTASTLQAQVKYKNTIHSSPSNSLPNLIAGVSISIKDFDAYNASSNKFMINITPPHEQIKDQTKAWVDSMNDMLDYLSEQTNYDKEDAKFKKIQSLQRFELHLADMIGVNLESIGMTRNTTATDVDGSIQFRMILNEDIFMDKIKNDFIGTKKLLGFTDSPSITDNKLSIWSKPSNINGNVNAKEIKVIVTSTTGTGDNAKVSAATIEILGGATITADISNGRIVGPAGSDFEGFEFLYFGGALTSPATYETNFIPTEGIMTKVSSFFDTYTREEKEGDNGIVETSFLTSQRRTIKEHMAKRLERIEESRNRLAKWADNLRARFAASQERVNMMNSARENLMMMLGFEFAK